MSAGKTLLHRVLSRVRGAAKIERRLWAPLETLMVTGVALLVGYFGLCDNPLSLEGSFPWLLFFPGLVALRYRTLYGLLSLFIIVFFFKGSLEGIDWLSYMVGSFGFILMIGEFSHSWFKDVKKSEEKYIYTEERLDSLSRAYYLLKLSHSHLEESLITKPVTLRKIVEEVRQLTIQGKGGTNPEALNLLLAMLSQYCGVISASFVAAHKGRLTDKILAHVGENVVINKTDPLLFEIEKSQGVRYQTIENLSDQKSDYLAVSSVISSDGQVLAYLVIKDMIFSSLNNSTMQILSVLLAYFANDSVSYEGSKTLLAAYPHCPGKFALEFKKMMDLHKGLGVKSYIVSIFIKNSDDSDYLVKRFIGIQRGLDCGWLHEREADKVHINLMPFSNAVAVIGYMDRMNSWFKSQFGQTMEAMSCYHTVKPVSELAPEKQIQACLERHV